VTQHPTSVGSSWSPDLWIILIPFDPEWFFDSRLEYLTHITTGPYYKWDPCTISGRRKHPPFVTTGLTTDLTQKGALDFMTLEILLLSSLNPSDPKTLKWANRPLTPPLNILMWHFSITWGPTSKRVGISQLMSSWYNAPPFPWSLNSWLICCGSTIQILLRSDGLYPIGISRIEISQPLTPSHYFLHTPEFWNDKIQTTISMALVDLDLTIFLPPKLMNA